MKDEGKKGKRYKGVEWRRKKRELKNREDKSGKRWNW